MAVQENKDLKEELQQQIYSYVEDLNKITELAVTYGFWVDYSIKVYPPEISRQQRLNVSLVQVKRSCMNS
ncbi:hypothetical protein GSUET_28470 [Geobacter sulfurreducens subsp. ethanolicus]|uniref:hypothetical protein n=1 Tax=Geobacter sulfurreducens TaxID=35554 RepID=UPI002572CCE1|nr:hypothetical protein [Geobacter sulfurreducens]BEH11235.1 hypothetical protein GSUET_28470 [Geobacter sulfurreducens subsp. ethanolicus]